MEGAANPRQSSSIVAMGPAALGGRVIGTFRVFNGTPSHSATPALLPYEYVFMKYGIESTTAKRMQELREKEPWLLSLGDGSGEPVC